MKKYIILAGVLLIIVLASMIVVIREGYIPVSDALEIRTPTGNAREIQSVIDSNYPESTDPLSTINEIIEDVPNVDKINYDIFETDVSYHDVYETYRSQLTNDGFSEKNEYSGYITHKGNDFHYYTFLKGIVAVVIGTTPTETGCIVLYTTGSVFDYEETVVWLSNQEYVTG